MTVKFQAEVNKGMIPIPNEFLEEFHDHSEVEVEVRAKNNKTEEEPYDIIAELMRNPIKVEGFKPFTRDEIYDRKL